jgi:hypothetical protein
VLAAYPAAQDVRLQWLAQGAGAVSLAILAVALVARSGPGLGWGLAALGGVYAVWFAEQGSALDELTPAYAAAFILVAELGFWSIEPRVEAWSDPELPLRRLAYLVVTCGGAAAVAALVLVLAAAGGGGGAVLEAVGVAAVIGALALLGVLVRRSATEVDSGA